MARLSDQRAKPHHPVIIELVGPAGAGKTTLARTLSRRRAGIHIADDLELRRKEHMPIFISHVHSLLPLFLHRQQSSRGLTWDESKAIVYLKAWSGVLRRTTTNKNEVVLLDHGPVFKLASLSAFGPEWLGSQTLTHWWDGMYKQWAMTLNMIIWLDTSDSELVERINTRIQRHPVKGKSGEEASAFLARYRTAYKRILARLLACKGPTPLRFDTSQVSVDQITAEVLAAIQSYEVRHAGVYPY